MHEKLGAELIGGSQQAPLVQFSQSNMHQNSPLEAAISPRFFAVRCYGYLLQPNAVRRSEVVLDALRYNLNPAVGHRIISSVLPNLSPEFRGFNGWLSV